MIKPYRIKHKDSGLYYQPTRNHCNLGKNGKVYMTNISPLQINNGHDYILIDVRTYTKIHKILTKLPPNQCKMLARTMDFTCVTKFQKQNLKKKNYRV